MFLVKLFLHEKANSLFQKKQNQQSATHNTFLYPFKMSQNASFITVQTATKLASIRVHRIRAAVTALLERVAANGAEQGNGPGQQAAL